jgi:predicted O-methyltransferase YrrM
VTTDQAIQKKFSFRGRHRNLPWYPQKGTRKTLAELFGELGFKEGVEVGTCYGEFAEILCLANSGGHLTCCDPWMPYHGGGVNRVEHTHAIAVERLAKYNVTILRKPSLEGAPTIKNGSLDYVYIDGDHMFDMVIQDILAWVPKVRKEGIIALHDYHSECGADVMMAINAYTHCHDIRPWYVTREQLPTAYWVQR